MKKRRQRDNEKKRVFAEAAITNVIDAVCKPENSFKSLKHKDIYTDWFESREEAEKLVEEAKTA